MQKGTTTEKLIACVSIHQITSTQKPPKNLLIYRENITITFTFVGSSLQLSMIYLLIYEERDPTTQNLCKHLNKTEIIDCMTHS